MILVAGEMGVFSLSGNVKKYKKNKGYESISRTMLQDVDNLSLQAIGLLAYMISMPDNWTFYKTNLYKRFAKNKRTAVNNAWKELVENRYIVQFRKRNGRKYDYYYYFSQEKFDDNDIKILEKETGCPVWDGKISTSKKKKSKTETSTDKNQQSKKSEVSTDDFQQSKMSSPKSTDTKLTSEQINNNNKDIDTKDTSFHHENNMNKKKEYIRKSFYENNDMIPKQLSDVFSVFCKDIKEAEKYYSLILKAKNKVSQNRNVFIWLEDEPELLKKITNTIVRCIRKIEKEGSIESPDDYIFVSIHRLLDEWYRPFYTENSYFNDFAELMNNK